MRYLVFLALPLCLTFGSLLCAQMEGLEEEGVEIKVTSTAFKEGEMIPKKYSGYGENISVPLAWTTVPVVTRTFVLLSDDPDAPGGDWVHWVMFNIPATVTELKEGVPARKTLDNGAMQGTNSSQSIGYVGPTPPSGTHRYYFKIYALDTELKLPPGSTKAQVLKAMKDHVIAQGQLMGRYKR